MQKKNNIVILAYELKFDFFVLLMQLNLFKSSFDDHFMSIEELRILRLRKTEIESKKKSRKYILEINKKYKNWSEKI